ADVGAGDHRRPARAQRVGGAAGLLAELARALRQLVGGLGRAQGDEGADGEGQDGRGDHESFLHDRSPPLGAMGRSLARIGAYNARSMPRIGPHTLTDRNREIRANFDAIAGRYDLTNRVISCGVDLHWRKVAVQALSDLPRGGRVLDLACGTCDLSLELLRRRPDARVTGADLSRAMLVL